MTVDDFKGKPHFGVKCSCGRACVSEITEEQAAMVKLDPVIGLRVLSPEDQQGLGDFWARHSALGHELEPTLCEIGPLNQSTN